MTGEEDHTVLDLPDTDHEVVAALLDIVYNGSIEASLEMIRKLLTLAHSLYISVPVSDQLMSMLGLQLPPQQKLPPGPSKPQGVEFPGEKIFYFYSILYPYYKKSFYECCFNCFIFPVSGLQAMSMWQQQILGQYAMMNGLLAPTGDSRAKSEAELSSLSCPLCGLAVPTVIEMRRHMASHEQNKDMMNHHLNQVIMSAFRPDNGSYVCSVCHSSYTNKGNFKQHIEKHFKNGEYPSAVNGGETLNGKHSIFGERSIIH